MIHSQADCVTEQEKHFVDILNSLNIAHEREPHIFLLHKENKAKTRLGVGMVPDFWLPDHGIHLELTTSKASSVCASKKRRKARRILQAMPYAIIRVLAFEEMDRLEHLLEDPQAARDYLTGREPHDTILPDRVMPQDIYQTIDTWNAAKLAGNHTLMRQVEHNLILTGWHLTKQNGHTLVRPVFHPEMSA